MREIGFLPFHCQTEYLAFQRGCFHWVVYKIQVGDTLGTHANFDGSDGGGNIAGGNWLPWFSFLCHGCLRNYQVIMAM